MEKKISIEFTEDEIFVTQMIIGGNLAEVVRQLVGTSTEACNEWFSCAARVIAKFDMALRQLEKEGEN